MFIAEIGINHNGSLSIALELINEAIEAGADVVKFQKRTPDVCVPKSQKHVKRQTPWGEMDYIDYKKKIEFEKDEYDVIDVHCKNKGIKWTASVWDEDSLDFIAGYDVPFIKIPSALIRNHGLLKAVAHTGKNVVVSTGMSSETDVLEAIEVLVRSGASEESISIMSCCSAYPAPLSELNLNTITYLKKKFPNSKIGYSSHSDELLPTIISKALGCSVFEHHFTFDKTAWGSDHIFSLTKVELEFLIRSLDSVDEMMGSYIPKITKSEEPARLKLQAS